MRIEPYIVLFFVISFGVGSVVSFVQFRILQSEELLGGVFFTQSITENEVIAKYQGLPSTPRKKVRILIVPGHDDSVWGTEFRGLREADINLALAKELENYFAHDPHFEAILARSDAEYIPELAASFAEEEKILSFREDHEEAMSRLVSERLIHAQENIMFHNNATSEVVVKLYGINKWANENDVDVVLHVHFNDHPDRNRRHEHPGRYNGFAIYIPEKQYSNALVSRKIAEKIFAELGTFFPVSNHLQEQAGVVEGQELTALGAFNTLDAASILIEYDYIYEAHLRDEPLRSLALREYAFQTYKGVKTYFENGNIISLDRTATLPHVWKSNLKKSRTPRDDVFALQLALTLLGVFPPDGLEKNDCPPSGVFGTCTEKGVIALQKKYGITPSSGYVGEITRGHLLEKNSLF